MYFQLEIFRNKKQDYMNFNFTKNTLTLVLTILFKFSICQTLISVSVIPINPTTGNGTKLRFKAIGVYSDNSTKDISDSVVWLSSNTSIATISNTVSTQGESTITAVGATTIQATYATHSGTSILNVVADADGDNAADVSDMCPYTYNPYQEDIDADNIGDSCDCSPSISDPLELYCASIDIAAFPNSNINTGTKVTFYSTLKSGYINSYNPIPNYQWLKNNLPVGTNAPTYSDSTLNNGDTIVCVISSGTNCVVGGSQTSNAIRISFSPLAINESNTSPINLHILPTPTKDFFAIKSNETSMEKFTFSILNMVGAVVKTGSAKFNEKISVDYLTNGIYLIQIHTEHNQCTTHKLIKQ
ncbi:MAG: T9SS type A sorting domain-containing protein [Chitinophagales bacterium]